MRHPEEFCIGFDIAMDWQKRKRQVLDSGKMPKYDLMRDDNIHYIYQPSKDVIYLMVEYYLSRGEAEFILHYDNYPQVRSCNEKNHIGEGI